MSKLRNVTLKGPSILHGNELQPYDDLSSIYHNGNSKRGTFLSCTADGNTVASGTKNNITTHLMVPDSGNATRGYQVDTNYGTFSNNKLNNASAVRILRMYNASGYKTELSITGYSLNAFNNPPIVTITGTFADNVVRTHTLTNSTFVSASTDTAKTYITYLWNSTLLPTYVTNNSVTMKVGETYTITIQTTFGVEILTVLNQRFVTPPALIQQSSNVSFGQCVSISDSGDRVVISAPNETVSGISNAGAAYVYDKSVSWSQTQKLTDLDTIQEDDNFGKCVAISGDGTTIAVGEPNRRIGANKKGLVHVYRFSGTWNRIASFSPTLPDNALFGNMIQISDDGFCIAVGAPGDSIGKIYMYEEDVLNTWTLKDTITPPNNNATSFGDINKCSLSSDGTVMSIASDKVYVYYRQGGGTWLGKSLPVPRNVTYKKPSTFVSTAISGNGQVVSGASTRTFTLASDYLSGIISDSIVINMNAGHFTTVSPAIESQNVILGRMSTASNHTFTTITPSVVNTTTVGSASKYSIYNTKAASKHNGSIEFVIHDVLAIENMIESITIYGTFGTSTRSVVTSQFDPAFVVTEGSPRTLVLYPSKTNPGDDSLAETTIEYSYVKNSGSSSYQRNSSVWKWDFIEATNYNKKNIFIPNNSYVITIKLTNLTQGTNFVYNKENDVWKIKNQEVPFLFRTVENSVGETAAMDDTGKSLFVSDTTNNAIHHFNNVVYSPAIDIYRYDGTGVYPLTLPLGNDGDIIFSYQTTSTNDVYIYDKNRTQNGQNVALHFSSAGQTSKETTYNDIQLSERQITIQDVNGGPSFNTVNKQYDLFSINKNATNGITTTQYSGSITQGYQFVIASNPVSSGGLLQWHTNLDDGLPPSTSSRSTLSPLLNRGKNIRSIQSGTYTYNSVSYTDVMILEIYGNYVSSPLQSFKISGSFNDNVFKTNNYSFPPIEVSLLSDAHGQYTRMVWDNTLLPSYSGTNFARLDTGKTFSIDIDGENKQLTSSITHDLNAIPEFFMVKNRDLDSNWYIWHKNLPSNNILTQSTSVPYSVSTIPAPTSTTIPTYFDTGIEYSLDILGSNFMSYIFKSSSVVDIGTYVGSGGVKTLNTVNSPAFMLVKNITATAQWTMLYINSEYNNAAYSASISSGSVPTLTDTFFDINTITFNDGSLSYNKLGNTYVYMVLSNAYIV